MNILRMTNALITGVAPAAQPVVALPGAESEADSFCTLFDSCHESLPA